jgi:Hsp20/alpha crystallin family
VVAAFAARLRVTTLEVALEDSQKGMGSAAKFAPACVRRYEPAARSASRAEDKNYHYSERAYGSFQRAFQLPASVDRDKLAADFSKGVLTITLPKTAEAQKPTKKIEVKST